MTGKEELTDHIEDAHPDARQVLLIGHRVEVA